MRPSDKELVLLMYPEAEAEECDLGWKIVSSGEILGIDDVYREGAWFDALRNIKCKMKSGNY
jgi:hypothetical protein